jgi:PIN domain nuclease of toxin-antitoxin system
VIFLDTHVLVWLASDKDRLSRPAASAIRRARVSDGIAISDIVIWELAFFFSRGILRTHGTVDATLAKLISSTGVVVRCISSEIAAIAAQLPP